MKNWLPFVFGPLLAMLTTPRAWCRRAGRISSSKSVPQMEVLVLGEAEAGEPVWIMKEGMERWKGERL